ncbi:MAG: hypothetical protein Q7W45_07830 [Bacteroidota bacterium]|nr:hypothetical protein [Bacteroidota bacterium]MDP3145997.1 hypothetical protein [Bacteroidota bacterium]
MRLFLILFLILCFSDYRSQNEQLNPNFIFIGETHNHTKKNYNFYLKLIEQKLKQNDTVIFFDEITISGGYYINQNLDNVNYKKVKKFVFFSMGSRIPIKFLKKLIHLKEVYNNKTFILKGHDVDEDYSDVNTLYREIIANHRNEFYNLSIAKFFFNEHTNFDYGGRFKDTLNVLCPLICNYLEKKSGIVSKSELYILKTGFNNLKFDFLNKIYKPQFNENLYAKRDSFMYENIKNQIYMCSNKVPIIVSIGEAHLNREAYNLKESKVKVFADYIDNSNLKNEKFILLYNNSGVSQLKQIEDPFKLEDINYDYYSDSSFKYIYIKK